MGRKRSESTSLRITIRCWDIRLTRMLSITTSTIPEPPTVPSDLGTGILTHGSASRNQGYEGPHGLSKSACEFHRVSAAAAPTPPRSAGRTPGRALEPDLLHLSRGSSPAAPVNRSDARSDVGARPA